MALDELQNTGVTQCSSHRAEGCRWDNQGHFPNLQMCFWWQALLRRSKRRHSFFTRLALHIGHRSLLFEHRSFHSTVEAQEWIRRASEHSCHTVLVFPPCCCRERFRWCPDPVKTTRHHSGVSHFPSDSLETSQPVGNGFDGVRTLSKPLGITAA